MQKIFEVNANHPLVTRLDAEADEIRFERLAKVYLIKRCWQRAVNSMTRQPL